MWDRGSHLLPRSLCAYSAVESVDVYFKQSFQGFETSFRCHECHLWKWASVFNWTKLNLCCRQYCKSRQREKPIILEADAIQKKHVNNVIILKIRFLILHGECFVFMFVCARVALWSFSRLLSVYLKSKLYFTKLTSNYDLSSKFRVWGNCLP